MPLKTLPRLVKISVLELNCCIVNIIPRSKRTIGLEKKKMNESTTEHVEYD